MSLWKGNESRVSERPGEMNFWKLWVHSWQDHAREIKQSSRSNMQADKLQEQNPSHKEGFSVWSDEQCGSHENLYSRVNRFLRLTQSKAKGIIPWTSSLCGVHIHSLVIQKLICDTSLCDSKTVTPSNSIKLLFAYATLKKIFKNF